MGGRVEFCHGDGDANQGSRNSVLRIVLSYFQEGAVTT
jgi:hypothetical protein